VHIIEQSLHKNPVALDHELWEMLRTHDLCRTPNEELIHQFSLARKIDIPHHTFAMHVGKMLTALLQSPEATKHMKIMFVDGEQLRIDAGFFETTWRIHGRWLTYQGAHEAAYCEEEASDQQHLFTCDHYVLELWDIMLSQLAAAGEHPRVAAEEAWLKSLARARLSQMPRSVQCVPTIKKQELKVRWDSVESHRNKDKPVKVILHSVDCTVEPALRQPDNEVLYVGDHGRSLTSCTEIILTRIQIVFASALVRRQRPSLNWA
jgi:hypothetical protein